MNGDRLQMPDAAAVAVEMMRDETAGLALAERLGIPAAKALAMRDALAHSVSASMQETIEAQARVIARQTEELAGLVRVAEAYRTGKHRGSVASKPVRPRLGALRAAIDEAERRAAAWAVAHLPRPVVRALRFVKARVVRP